MLVQMTYDTEAEINGNVGVSMKADKHIARLCLYLCVCRFT